MSDDMRQELNDVKATMREISITVAGHTETLARHTATLRRIATTVAVHTETLARMEKRLSKLDAIDVIAKNLESFAAEIIASRNECTLMGKSFFDQQETLTDHELRLTRLESDKRS